METLENYNTTRSGHWNKIAKEYKDRLGFSANYHRRLGEIYKNIIPPGSRVLELGCGKGDLLASLKPSYGVGVDFSASMVETACERHPSCKFLVRDVHSLDLDTTFDFIILSDLINDLWDVQSVFETTLRHCNSGTRVIINSYSHLWQYPLLTAASLGMSKPVLEQNWLEVPEISNLLYQSGFDILRVFPEFLFPLRIPLIEQFFNRILVRFWPFNWLALTNVFITRPQPAVNAEEALPTVSVIVPARNEAGNIPEIFKRVPQMGHRTEIVFVEGHSRDETYQVILDNKESHPEVDCVVLKQSGVGKGDAVRAGFNASSGEILMILDADLTVPPEDLPRFYRSLVNGRGEFINGVRLVYPMEKQAMRFLNLVGNKFFSLAFTWMLGQPVSDTLCGTKVLWRKDYDRIAANRSYFGDFDPFGDYDLIFGAAHLNLKIVDMPIRYKERTYGSTNIQRWRHGWLLLRMVLVAARLIKFI